MKKLAAVLAIVAVASVPSVASAQRFGAQVGYGTEIESVSLGARAEFDLTNKFSQKPPFSNAMVVAAFDYYLDCEGCSYWELTPALVVPFTMQGSTMRPYLGAGLSFAHVSVDDTDISDTETGLALLGGLRFPMGTMSAFTEARITLHDADQLTLAFGFLFGGPKK
jgi:opacity protein-like surface antigen